MGFPNRRDAIRSAAALIALASGQAHARPEPGPPLVTPEWLGNPAAARWPNDYYPRNVWDLQTFGGFLYIGSGNSSNFGPSQNAGPVPILRYDGRRFESVFTVRDEQVEQFRVFGRDLYVPGHDARQDWSFGNLYKFDRWSWQAFRAIPNGIHVYDIHRSGGRMIAVGGAQNQEIPAWIADDAEGPWRSLRLTPSADIIPGGQYTRRGPARLYSIFTIGEAILASGVAYLQYATDAGNAFVLATLFQFDGEDSFTPIAAQDAEGRTLGGDLFPMADRPQRSSPQVRRATILGGQTYYIGALAHNDHQWLPFGVFAASSVASARRLTPPEGSQVYDLLAHRGKLYALGNVALAPGEFEVQILRLREDGQTFDVAGRFLSPAFARSFEFYQGNWYFGLGSEISAEEARLTRAEASRVDWGERLSSETGAILWVPGGLAP